MSEINPNIPVTAQDPVSQNGPDTPTTFDELEQVLAKPRSKSAQAKASEGKDSEKKEAKQETKDLTDDRDKGPAKKEAKSEKKEPDAKDDGKEKAKDELEAKAKKAIKAKRGDEDVDLDEDVLFTVKVNGKDEPVTLKDLMGNYSGKVAYDKKFSELDRDRKTWQTKFQDAEGKIKAIFEEQDPDKRWYSMAALAGADPVQYRTQYLTDNLKVLEKWHSMTEDERKADALEFERNYYKHRAETGDNHLKTEQAKQALKVKIDGILATHKIPPAEFISYHDQLESMIQAGTLEKEKLTPEFIVEVMQKDKLWNAVAPKLEQSGFDEAKQSALIKDLVDTAHQHGLDEAATAELADELWGSRKRNKVIADKVQARDEFLNGKRDGPKHTPVEATFFDEML